MNNNILFRFTFFVALSLTLFTACSLQKTKPQTGFFSEKKSNHLPVDSLLNQYFLAKRIPIRQNNRVKLLPSGREKFKDLFEHILKAQRYIHLEYFNFRNDSISREVFNLLARKKSEGVKVRILFDAFGNLSNNQPLKKNHLDSLRLLGLEIVKYDPIRFPWVNHIATRDHRKIVVIDGSVAYLGGMNVADYYINGLEKIGSWRDMHSRIEGEAVKDIQEIFDQMWKKATNENITHQDTIQPVTGNVTLAVVDRSPKAQPNVLREAIAVAIVGAKKEINIVNPYFVPTRAIMQAVKKAIDKGVKINIMVSEKSDIPFTPDAMKYKLRRLAKRGAKVYLYQNGFHHSKVMTVDGCLATIGSANLNSRSLRYDYETNLFIFDEGVTKELDSLYLSDQKYSILLDDYYWKKRSLWKKIIGWFANLFTPFL